MQYIVLFILLILLMGIIRFFVPLLIYCIPVIFIIYVLRLLFGRRKQRKTYQQEYTQYDDGNEQTMGSDVIDVDYKVVDEEENIH